MTLKEVPIILNTISSEKQEIPLEDTKTSGILLYSGKLTGMSNMARWGEAEMETR